MIPLVMEMTHRTPRWKIPGGRMEFGETPEITAVRELEEETGINVGINDLKLVQRLNLSGHDRYLYQVEILSFADLRERGTEGEIVRIFTIKEIQIMDDLLIQHRKLLIDMGLIT
jgi:8-oxo-dGTP pyrophosphatase MutT (NUDIX family)